MSSGLRLPQLELPPQRRAPVFHVGASGEGAVSRGGAHVAMGWNLNRLLIADLLHPFANVTTVPCVVQSVAYSETWGSQLTPALQLQGHGGVVSDANAWVSSFG
jgi:hypothetical protein